MLQTMQSCKAEGASRWPKRLLHIWKDAQHECRKCRRCALLHWHLTFQWFTIWVEGRLSRHHCSCCLIWDVSHCPNRRFEGWWVHVWWDRNVDLHIVCNTTPEGEQLCQLILQNQQTHGLRVAKAKTSGYSLLQIVSMCRKSTTSILVSLCVKSTCNCQAWCPKVSSRFGVSCNHF